MAIPEGECKSGAEECASEPGPGVEELAGAVITDLAKVGERGFSGDRTEVGLDGE